MAGIIKNQLLKHLSRFVKHLSSDRINVSTLKGEGELTDLELDEDVLTDLLALPTWMKIKKAHCNRVNIRIPWTRLKSLPILLALDKVNVQIETCEEFRKTAADAQNHVASSAGKYGFVNKVIDGITVTVESVEMTFHSREFESRVQISRIRVESRSPQWRSGVELTHSRLKDVRRGEVLVFKEVTWQNLRLEAQSTSDRHLAPLRLLTNQARARIVIKKRLIDCQVVACRLSVILEELLWVLTDSQILAALHFVNSLSGLVKQATEETQRIKAKRKLESLPEYQAQQHQATAMNSSMGGGTDAAKIFEAFDIKETSYHFICDRIILHLLDDPGNGRSIHPDLINGAALQINFAQIMLDFYPYHLARASRKSWPRYSENHVFNWLKESLEAFNVKLMDTILPQNEHRPLARAGTESYSQSPSLSSKPDNKVRTAVGEKIAKLMSTCLVIRIQNVCIYKATTSSKESLQPFLSGYMERPKDLHGIHIEFTWFYHPGELCFPLPSPKIFAYMHPIQVDLDVDTVLWLNAFASNLTESLTKIETETEEPYADLRFELIQPRVVYKCKPYPSQKARPTTLYFQLSRVVMANYRSAETGTREQLLQCLESLKVENNPNAKPQNQNAQSEKLSRFYRHCNNEDLVRKSQVIQKKVESFQDLTSLSKEMLWTEPRDIWFLRVDSFWADFCFEAVGSQKKRSNLTRFESMTDGGVWGGAGNEQLGPPSPFIDPVPLSGWIYAPPPVSNSSVAAQLNTSSAVDELSSPLCVLLNSQSIVSVQLTHYQYLFLMRMVEAFGELSLYLNLDAERVIGELAAKAKSLFLMVNIPRIEVSLLFPAAPPPQLPRDNSTSDNGIQSSPSPSQDFATCTPMMHSAISEPSLPAYQLPQSQPTSMLLPDRQPNLETTKAKSASTLDPYNKASTPVSASPLNKPMPTLDMLTDNLKQGMKQGLSTVFAFSKTGGLSTPDSEVGSTFSTSGSSDNIQFEHLELDDQEKVEGLDDNVEVAEEVVEDHEPLAPNFIPNGPRAHEYETINILVVQLSDIIVCQEAVALDSDIRVTAASLGLDEVTEIQWQEFQRKFIARSKKWKTDRSSFGSNQHQQASSINHSASKINSTPVVRVHLTQKIDGNMVKAYDWRTDKPEVLPKSNSALQKLNLIDSPGGDSLMRKLIIDATQPGLNADVDLSRGQELVLNMSSVVNLTDLVEDEIIPVPFPFEITIYGGKLKLIEDRPPVNITSPGAPPIKVSIPQSIHVQRDEYGVIYIGDKNMPYIIQKASINDFEKILSDLINSVSIRSDDDIVEEEDENSNGSANDVEISEDTKRLQKLNEVILKMEQKLRELKSEKCNLILRINCDQTERIINKKN
ncbi:unnamed protein product [Orchesella dallaii]|uniref:UHRF1-binding protein 1-like n=1 Tax=Orchesella dallaii TaxID=48710 RepID=A0ABP1PQ07_9HEXA